MSDNEQARKKAIRNVETEYHEINSKAAWGLLYQHIRSVTGAYLLACNESKKPQNKNLNRYRDVAPYDHSRVILKRGVCDYIHANYIPVDRAKRHYILTQGPLPHTAGHLWLMVWEQNCKAVLMLNKVIEKNQVKCHQYWPLGDTGDTVMTFDDVGIKVKYVSKVESSDYTTRTLRITDLESNDSREILHFHYTTWPDFGVPQCPTAFLRFLADVRQSGVLDQNAGPPVVHCSAGIGRSGTFCLVDTCLVLIEENGLNSVSVRDVLLEMRKYRMGLIQTPDQLRFSYAAIIEGAKQLPLNNVTASPRTIEDDDVNDVINNYNFINHPPSEKDDEPPPLPPPRAESLTRSVAITDTSLEKLHADADHELGGPPDKPLPSEPPTYTEPCTSPPLTTSTSVTDVLEEHSVPLLAEVVSDDSSEDRSSPLDFSCDLDTVRRRRREERAEKNERLATQVRDMKRRQRDCENWQKFKRRPPESLSSHCCSPALPALTHYLSEWRSSTVPPRCSRCLSLCGVSRNLELGRTKNRKGRMRCTR
ncbi:tyrosine-protein phosphatase non-receptor type 2 isoform X1 [Harpegnathos saltator]|uniref:tyrosine-protein phosphatase non-receptor type 2 isoform X1 n=1 Tax=Harpegnathos saltator TaxID=610380 RepID=UPI000DBEE3C3|nr:tyrosine-protein phosphatase non-receptor type 2 isoform X1 [Harpegnathos saltator]XP_025163634.1 tyrosine-protein phosphatase non-receptor type 2 isoform X1 [Harpegnathos saltator]